MAVIFDLDMTIIDSSLAEPLRKRRDWGAVYRMIPSFRPYEGTRELLHELQAAGIGTAIVTTSPRPYCEKIMSHWGISADTTVCYHDTKFHKPHPEPIIKAVAQLKSVARIVSIGDTHSDIVAARAAGLIAVGAMWGIADAKELLSAAPDHSFHAVADFRTFLKGHFSF